MENLRKDQYSIFVVQTVVVTAAAITYSGVQKSDTASEKFFFFFQI